MHHVNFLVPANFLQPCDFPRPLVIRSALNILIDVNVYIRVLEIPCQINDPFRIVLSKVRLSDSLFFRGPDLNLDRVLTTFSHYHC